MNAEKLLEQVACHVLIEYVIHNRYIRPTFNCIMMFRAQSFLIPYTSISNTCS